VCGCKLGCFVACASFAGSPQLQALVDKDLLLPWLWLRFQDALSVVGRLVPQGVSRPLMAAACLCSSEAHGQLFDFLQLRVGQQGPRLGNHTWALCACATGGVGYLGWCTVQWHSCC
jgi:hypothetical protein